MSELQRIAKEVRELIEYGCLDDEVAEYIGNWQAARESDPLEHGELHETMTDEFKSAWRNGLSLDSMEAKWAFVGWQEAIAKGGQDKGRVAIPRDVAEAKGMYLVGYSWLKHNAPDELTNVNNGKAKS